MPSVRVIHTEQDREEILAYIRKARLKSRVEVKGPARTNDQNSKMWAMLTDITRQRKQINGQEFKPEQWKCIFMEALGHEQDILPKLDGSDFFVSEQSTSKLSVEQMSALIEFMFAWGAENNVEWSDPELRSLMEAIRR
jgi:hypothetical protein